MEVPLLPSEVTPSNSEKLSLQNQYQEQGAYPPLQVLVTQLPHQLMYFKCMYTLLFPALHTSVSSKNNFKPSFYSFLNLSKSKPWHHQGISVVLNLLSNCQAHVVLVCN